MFGFWNVNKPVGVTSRDVVTRIQRIVKPLKVGHAGTLDPLASGVLVVACGPATRLIENAQQLSKEYVAEFQLGRSSAGDDLESEVTIHRDLPIPTLADLEAAVPKFLGDIEQVPPAHSAVKVKGKRAYELARKGEDVQLSARVVRIDTLDILNFEFPTLNLKVRCGSGTYIRSLGRDLAAALGTRAVMSALERTAIGPFVVSDALAYREIDRETLIASLHQPGLVLAGLPTLILDDEAIADIRQGRKVSIGGEPSVGETSLVNQQGELIAIGQVEADRITIKPVRVFHSSP